MDLKLRKYIQEEKAKGTPTAIIASNLTGRGWTQKQIDTAFESLHSMPAKETSIIPETKPSKIPKFLDPLIVITSIIVFGFLSNIYIYFLPLLIGNICTKDFNSCIILIYYSKLILQKLLVTSLPGLALISLIRGSKKAFTVTLIVITALFLYDFISLYQIGTTQYLYSSLLFNPIFPISIFFAICVTLNIIIKKKFGEKPASIFLKITYLTILIFMFIWYLFPTFITNIYFKSSFYRSTQNVNIKPQIKSDWLEFTGSNFTFQYPKDWELTTSPATSDGRSFIRVAKNGNEYVSIQTNYVGPSPQQMYSKVKTESVKFGQTEATKYTSISDLDKETFNGVYMFPSINLALFFHAQNDKKTVEEIIKSIYFKPKY